MSEEEIINKWFEKNMCVSFKKFIENWEEQQELTNYLQEKNSQLKENNLSMQEEMCRCWEKVDKLKQRIEKAIEYIKERTEFNQYSEVYPSVLDSSEVKKILKILKGDKE